MDQIVNYSDFVESQLQAPAGIARWYQFRIFKDRNGEAQIQCRESTLEGVWGGICDSVERDSIMTQLFKPGQNGRVTVSTIMPPSQRRGLAMIPEIGKKSRVHLFLEGLKKFETVYELNAGQMQSLRRDIQSLVSLDPIPFHWTQDDITTLYGRPHREDAQEDYPCDEDNEESQVFAMEIDQFYLYRERDKEPPFTIGRCIQRVKLPDPALNNDDEQPGAYLVLMQPKDPRNWRTCKWVSEQRDKNLQKNTHQWDASVEQYAMFFTKEGHLTVKSIRNIKYYTERWENPLLQNEWDETEPPETGGENNMLSTRKIRKGNPNRQQKKKKNTDSARASWTLAPEQ